MAGGGRKSVSEGSMHSVGLAYLVQQKPELMWPTPLTEIVGRNSDRAYGPSLNEKVQIWESRESGSCRKERILAEKRAYEERKSWPTPTADYGLRGGARSRKDAHAQPHARRGEGADV